MNKQVCILMRVLFAINALAGVILLIMGDPVAFVGIGVAAFLLPMTAPSG